jgi:hypothetical protein
MVHCHGKAFAGWTCPHSGNYPYEIPVEETRCFCVA